MAPTKDKMTNQQLKDAMEELQRQRDEDQVLIQSIREQLLNLSEKSRTPESDNGLPQPLSGGEEERGETGGDEGEGTIRDRKEKRPAPEESDSSDNDEPPPKRRQGCWAVHAIYRDKLEALERREVIERLCTRVRQLHLPRLTDLPLTTDAGVGMGSTKGQQARTEMMTEVARSIADITSNPQASPETRLVNLLRQFFYVEMTVERHLMNVSVPWSLTNIWPGVTSTLNIDCWLKNLGTTWRERKIKFIQATFKSTTEATALALWTNLEPTQCKSAEEFISVITWARELLHSPPSSMEHLFKRIQNHTNDDSVWTGIKRAEAEGTDWLLRWGWYVNWPEKKIKVNQVKTFLTFKERAVNTAVTAGVPLAVAQERVDNRQCTLCGLPATQSSACSSRFHLKNQHNRWSRSGRETNHQIATNSNQLSLKDKEDQPGKAQRT